MLFTSLAFLLFLPLVFGVYWYVVPASNSIRNAWLLVASYVFYGWAYTPWLALLIGSTVFNYLWALYVLRPQTQKWGLPLGVGLNLGILGICKYTYFISHLFDTSTTWGKWVIPLGISFYTFHALSYLLDVHRKTILPERNAVNFGLFMAFFPLLVAGPIERAHHLLPQIQQQRNQNTSQWIIGLQLMAWGFVKKMGIADGLAETADLMFNHYTQFHGISLIMGIIAFSFQIYADFSGYSDIARGLAQLFGFNLLLNFNFPYLARNLTDFWRRWHISLSFWFRDYVFFPLGGSRANRFITYRNILLVFLLSGIWHGPAITFVLWGLIHAGGYVIQTTLPALPNTPMYTWIQRVLTWSFVTFGWLFFRAETPAQAWAMMSQIGNTLRHNPFPETIPGKGMLVYVIPFFLMEWYQRQNPYAARFPKHPVVRYIVSLGLALWIVGSILSENESPAFLYFNF